MCLGLWRGLWGYGKEIGLPLYAFTRCFVYLQMLAYLMYNHLSDRYGTWKDMGCQCLRGSADGAVIEYTPKNLPENSNLAITQLVLAVIIQA